MTADKIVALLGLLTGGIASACLAVSVTHLVKAIMLCINAFDVTLQTYFSAERSVPVFTGLDKHLQRGLDTNKKYTVAGFILLCVSFVLQSIALII